MIPLKEHMHAHRKLSYNVSAGHGCSHMGHVVSSITTPATGTAKAHHAFGPSVLVDHVRIK